MIIVERPTELPFMHPQFIKLPGVAPIDETDWIVTPDDLIEQLQYKDKLFEQRRSHVLRTLEQGVEPAEELLEVLLNHLQRAPEWRVAEETVTRPDGATIAIDSSAPMLTVGRLVSEDFCLLAKSHSQSEYALVAAALCFPSGWTLADKIGLPLTDIHEPVPYYTGDLANRVNRIFDGVRDGRVLLRYNWSVPTSAELHAPSDLPRRESGDEGNIRHFLRVERQTLRRLPKSDAVAFGIRVTFTPIENLKPKEARTLLAILRSQDEEVVDYKDGSKHHDDACEVLAAIIAQ